MSAIIHLFLRLSSVFLKKVRITDDPDCIDSCEYMCYNNQTPVRKDESAMYDDIFERLGRSEFRSRFRLTPKDIDYIDRVGFEKIESHAADFVAKRIAPADIPNDGRHTPMRGHPVFTAQHACACCCRGCMYKWYRIPTGRELTVDEQKATVGILIEWIRREYERQK